MGLATTWSVALLGVAGQPVEVQCHVASGLPLFTVTGLPDTAVTQARDRVRAAVLTSGEQWPQRRTTIGLYPATLPKTGSALDLAIAVAVLAAAGAVPARRLGRLVLLGELGLDGRLRAVPGVLPAVMAAVAAGHPDVIVPAACAAEAQLVPGARVTGASTLRSVLARLRGETVVDEAPEDVPSAGGDGRRLPSVGPVERVAGPDLRDVLGQVDARRAVEVAAAGGHHLLLTGEPGCGKTMLAERLPGLLPDLDLATALQVSAVHSVAGALPPGAPLVVRPPFRAPHHTVTAAALIGGGSGRLRPGAASCAHRGVLFLDEVGEFGVAVLETLRQSMESGQVEVARASGSAVFPARFQLVLASNRCPCGAPEDLGCTCLPGKRARYDQRLSAPLLDRVDLRVRMSRPTAADLLDAGPPEPSTVVAERVRLARESAARRLAGTPWQVNGEVPGPELTARWPVPPGWEALVRPLGRLPDVSARAAHALLRVAWTLSDLEGAPRAGAEHLAAAMALRELAS